MSNIRVTYSGLVAFLVGITSILTGLIFTLIITRNLTPEEFGTWALINSMISYFLISEGIIYFWTVRQVARGEEIARTSVTSTLIFSFAIIPFYLVASYFVSDNSNSELNAMIFAIILIPVFFMSKILNGINLAHRPQVTSYGLLAFEIIKIPVVLALVYVFDLGIYGVLISLLIAYMIKLIIQFYFAKSKLHNKFKFSELKRWIKLTWISLYSNIPSFIANLDVLIYTLITGSVIGIAYYGVSLAIANITLHSKKVTLALYPKLLSHGSNLHIQENFQLLLYFALPLLGIALVFSKPALFALNPIYSDGSLIIIILAFKSFFSVLNETFRQVLMGVEKVDVEKNASFSQLAKSKLFFVSSIWSIKSVIYLTILIIILSILNVDSITEVELVTVWAVVLLSIEVPFFIYSSILLLKTVEFHIHISPILKYIGSTIILIMVYFLTSDYIIHYHQSIFDFLPGVLLQFLICIGVYLGITYIIDNNTRKMFKSIIREIT